MDGLMLADAIRADPAIAGTPMVLLTSVGETTVATCRPRLRSTC